MTRVPLIRFTEGIRKKGEEDCFIISKERLEHIQFLIDKYSENIKNYSEECSKLKTEIMWMGERIKELEEGVNESEDKSEVMYLLEEQELKIANLICENYQLKSHLKRAGDPYRSDIDIEEKVEHMKRWINGVNSPRVQRRGVV